MKQKITFLTIMLLFTCGLFAQETLITAWTFDDLPKTEADTQTPLVISSNADVGAEPESGTIYADGTNGSSAFSNIVSAIEITSFGGNVLNDPRPSPVSGNALALANSSANGKSIVFKFSSAGYANLVMTFILRKTQTGFNTHTWAYSTDGVNFTTYTTDNTANTTVGTFELCTVDFSSATAINDQTDVYIRLTLNGASNATGNNRFDNFQITGTPSGPDEYAPRLTGFGMVNATSMKLTFNEALNQTIAETASNYSLEGEYTITDATLSDDRFVTLTINPALTEGDNYTLTIRNMKDLAENVMADSTFTFTYGVSSEFQKATIAALREVAPTYGSTDGNDIVYKFTGEAIITYMITNRNQKYIQDGTAAILIDDQAGIMGSGYEIGDKVTGFYGKLSNYFGMVQFTPTENGTTVGWNEEVTPEVVNVSAFDSVNTNAMQAKLVKVDHVSFSNTGNFETNTYYNLIQTGVTYPAVVFTNNWTADYIGSEIPTYSVALTGVVNFAREQNRMIILNKNSMTSVRHFNPSMIKMSPNPAADYVNIETDEAMQMQLFAITGQLITSEALLAGSNIVSVNHLNPGIYIVKLTNSAGTIFSSKLIVR